MTSISPEGTARQFTAAEPIVNISCYKFASLDNLEERRSSIRRLATELNLKGTVLLSSEGINLFVAASRPSIDAFVEFLRSDPLLADLHPKESISDYQPFNRMLVKIKQEIIAFGVDAIEPGRKTSPKLPAAELKQWLDSGRRVHLLDVRNDYEYDLGTFENAIRMNLDHFRHFPEAVAQLPESLKNEPVVMFCTGGIRCEKAGPYMEQAGFQQVYQLDGGILKYFEEVGGDHYQGECFVFDQRVAVNPALQETATTQCYACQEVVTQEDQKSPRYVPGKSCPACYLEPAERLVRLLEQRQQQVRELTITLPGSQPYFNNRPLNVPARFAGLTLIDFLTAWHPQIEREEWQRRIQNGLIVPGNLRSRRRRRGKSRDTELPLSPELLVREGERFEHLQPGTIEPDVNPAIQFLYEDDALIVINKPAPLPMHPCGRFNRNTLRYLINQIYYPERPHMVHRLDANTSGVLVMCRKQSAARRIQPQFENRTIQKSYLARVQGHPGQDKFSCSASLSSEAAEGGIRQIVSSEDGDEALTRFEVLERFNDGSTLLQAQPVTGRTNQIRAHLWYLGFPICGDPAYLSNGHLGINRTLLPHEPCMCLHAESIQLVDAAGNHQTFSAPRPTWAGTTQ